MNQADKVHDAIKNLDLSGKSRPSTSGGGTMEANKDSSLSFLPDLWKLISRDTTESGSVLGHDVVTFYISSDNGTTLLRPPKPNVDVSLPESLRIRPRPTSLGLMTKEDHDILTEGLSQVSRSLHAGHPILSTSNSSTVASLLSLFNENMQMSQSQYDFQASHFWFKCLQALTSLPSNAIDEFLLAITKNYRYNIETSIEICDQLQDWLFALEARRKTQSSIVHQSGIESRSLRDKMWFVSDVRHSSTYEDSLHVTRALKTMSGLVLTRQSGMAAWARQRLRSSFGHERAQAQVLETLAADKETGGPNKLTDGQVDLVSRWLLQEGIENLCKGEERIHRFCFEVQKCARKLVADTLMESPVLWSSVLYQQEKQDFVSGSGHHGTPSTSEYPSWRSEFSSSGISNLSQLPATSPNPGFSSYDASRPGFTFKNGGSNRPGSGSVAYGLAIQDPGIFPSQPPNTYASLPQNWVFPPSPVSPMMMNNSSDVKLPQKQAFVEQLRSTITNLLLSDLGSVLWTFGSETDRWVLDYQRHLQEQISNDPPIVLTQTSVSVQSSSPTKTITVDTYKANDDSEIDDQSCQTPTTRRQPAAHIPGNTFPYHESFKKLLEKFQLSSDPRLKLKALHDLVSLIESRSRSSNAAGESETSPVPSNDPVLQDLTSHGLLGVGLPRTRLTRLQEVTANCEDRRLTSLATSTMGNPLAVTSLENLFTRPVDQRGHNTVAIIRAMFHDSSYRPPTFFRDLQYIAAFIPSSVLDHSAQGNAFWTVALAAMSLKSEMCKLMTSRATQILAHHLENGSTREPIREGSKERPRATVGNKMSQEELSHTTLEDAAQMYMLSALEGDPTAARELGLFYLTHPELVKRVTLPLSRPSEVFRPFINPSGDRNHRATGDGGGVLEPGTFAVAFHWMEFAANAGDADARTFLRENGELGRGW